MLQTNDIPNLSLAIFEEVFPRYDIQKNSRYYLLIYRKFLDNILYEVNIQKISLIYPIQGGYPESFCIIYIVGIKMMIILDIDDTVLDHSGAEIAAANLFGQEFADRIPDYEEGTFVSKWRTASEKHIATFLEGKIDFQEQRRRRIREVFHNDSMSADQVDTLFSVYLRHYENSWRAFPDVLPFLERHGDRGIGILSDGAQAQQEAKLKAIGVYPYVTFVVTAESTGMSKPDVRMFHQACALAKVSPSDACYIGDNLKKDAIGAISAGLRGVWLNREEKVVPEGIEAINSLLDYMPNKALHWTPKSGAGEL